MSDEEKMLIENIQDSDFAKDITQETFLRIWNKRKSLQPEKSFFSLLARISTNYVTTTSDIMN